MLVASKVLDDGLKLAQDKSVRSQALMASSLILPTWFAATKWVLHATIATHFNPGAVVSDVAAVGIPMKIVFPLITGQSITFDGPIAGVIEGERLVVLPNVVKIFNVLSHSILIEVGSEAPGTHGIDNSQQADIDIGAAVRSHE